MQSLNLQRSQRIDNLLEWCDRGDQNCQETLIDLLADAMHWCDANGEDFHIALAQACRHYIHELNDQQQDERRLNP